VHPARAAGAPRNRG